LHDRCIRRSFGRLASPIGQTDLPKFSAEPCRCTFPLN
jgi:hypothetical protein